MTPRERFITALEGGRPGGRVPHFELVFFLTMEAFGRVHPSQRHYRQWGQMAERERDLHRRDIADLYVQTARRYEHAAIFFHAPGGWGDRTEAETRRCLDLVREISGDEFFLMVHGDPTFAMPDGGHMMAFVERLADDRPGLLQEAARRTDDAIARAERYARHGALDGFALCSDYCFNTGPFLSPAMFDEFVTPFLARTIGAYRDLGLYAIKHTDGNIMPILGSLAAARPHALHSLDPQGGVDLAEVKRLVGGQVCLIGNVNCGLLDTGTDEEVVESARYALRHGMPGGGYVFSTSNCIYTGMRLERYELMLGVWREEGNYSS
jgi:uroporphyrinogen decarboxylase